MCLCVCAGVRVFTTSMHPGRSVIMFHHSPYPQPRRGEASHPRAFRQNLHDCIHFLWTAVLSWSTTSGVPGYLAVEGHSDMQRIPLCCHNTQRISIYVPVRPLNRVHPVRTFVKLQNYSPMVTFHVMPSASTLRRLRMDLESESFFKDSTSEGHHDILECGTRVAAQHQIEFPSRHHLQTHPA